MLAPEFLRIDEVLRIHEDQIERHGGSPDLRDAGLLISAVEMPRATFDSAPLHADLFEMAAAYLFHIVQNHPFGRCALTASLCDCSGARTCKTWPN